MSRWTYITATIVVDTFANKKDIKKYAERKLKKAPIIYGGEENASIYVNRLNGYNTYIDSDCEQGKYQTKVYITIVGDLRYRSKEDVLKEYIDFLNYITKELKFYIDMRCEYIEEFTCNEDENTIYAIKNGKIIS